MRTAIAIEFPSLHRNLAEQTSHWRRVVSNTMGGDDVPPLEGENANAIREGVRVALADYEQIFRAQEVNKRMKDKAAHACHALCRARLVEEIRRRKGTAT